MGLNTLEKYLVVSVLKRHFVETGCNHKVWFLLEEKWDYGEDGLHSIWMKVSTISYLEENSAWQHSASVSSTSEFVLELCWTYLNQHQANCIVWQAVYYYLNVQGHLGYKSSNMYSILQVQFYKNCFKLSKYDWVKFL